MAKITKDMPINKIVMEHPETFEVFAKHGLHCVGCAAAQFENLEQGAQAHGIEIDPLLVDLNKAVEGSGESDDDSSESSPEENAEVSGDKPKKKGFLAGMFKK